MLTTRETKEALRSKPPSKAIVNKILNSRRGTNFTKIRDLPSLDILSLFVYCKLSIPAVISLYSNRRNKKTIPSEIKAIAKEIKDTLGYGNWADLVKDLLPKSSSDDKLKKVQSDVKQIFQILGKGSKTLDIFFKKLEGGRDSFKAKDYLDYLHLLRFQYMEVSINGYTDTVIEYRGLVNRNKDGSIKNIEVAKNSKLQELISVRVSQSNRPDIRLLLGLAKINEEIVKIESMLDIQITEKELSQKYQEYQDRTKAEKLKRIEELVDIEDI